MGAAFVGLVFVRAGVSTSVSERQFGFRIGRRLFSIWLITALAQFYIGLALICASPLYSYQDCWVFIAIITYLISLAFWDTSYDRYRLSNEADREGRPLRTLTTLYFLGNVFFGLGILSATLVIVLMSLKHAIAWLSGL